MRILSVDFDYFQQVAKEQVQNLYPDGIDNPTKLSEFVWGGHYATNGKELKAIGIMQNEFDCFKDILMFQSEDIPVMITNSHKHVYDFIHEHQGENEKLGLINVDMHHDMMNDNPEMDCGNWISHIITEYKTAFNWVANPISLDTYGIGKHEDDKPFVDMVRNSLNSIKDESFDAVFLCRSDTWSPPHLDRYFTELCDCCKRHFNEIEMETGIDVPRREYLSIAKAIKEADSKIKKEMMCK